MITAARKTGFLIEDGAYLGQVVEVLRQAARIHGDYSLRSIANYLDRLPVGTYYEPIQQELIEQIVEPANV